MSIRMKKPPVLEDSDDKKKKDKKNNNAAAMTTVPECLAHACQQLVEAHSLVVSERRHICEQLTKLSSTLDAYVSLRHISQGRLPPLDWSVFRKAYSFMVWMQPCLGKSSSKQKSQDDNNNDASFDRSAFLERCLYRFSTEPDKTSRKADAEKGRGGAAATAYSLHPKCHGVAVYTSPWILTGDNNNIAETTLTAMILPTLETPLNSNTQLPSARCISCRLQLPLGEWSLVTCSHVCPYLKRPQWTVSVNGLVVFSAELEYPSVPGGSGALMSSTWNKTAAGGAVAAAASIPSSTMTMQDNVVLQNIVAGGILCKDDNKDNATTTTKSTIRSLTMNIASLAVYPDVVPSHIQAVLAASANGSCLTPWSVIPTIPPIPNWSKGSSVNEGLPKVGTPLMVHASALEIQKLVDHLVFGVTANEGYVVGQDGRTLSSSLSMDEDDEEDDDSDSSQPMEQPHQRIILTMTPQPGSMSDTPRVGLIQPGQPIRTLDKDDCPCLYLTGNCTLTRTMDRVWTTLGPVKQEFGSTTTTSMDTTNMAPWSVALLDQNVLAAILLPFFLALTPPGKLYEKQEDLYQDSIRQLQALYTEDGAYAAQLVTLLWTMIKNGGARVQEEVLQSGSIHVLVSNLRLSLNRANRINFFSSSSMDVNDVAKRLKRLRDDCILEPNSSKREYIAPRYVPMPIVQACELLIDVTCGPAANSIDRLSPAHRVTRTSDLALTVLFALALDMDLWGGDAKASARIFGAVADRYGGFCSTYGYILRSQVSVQYFLDVIRLAYEGQVPSDDLEQVGLQLCRLLTAMLLASLANRRSISQAEQDVTACIRALTDALLGSLVAHIVLNSLVSVLVFCDILPAEVGLFFTEHNTAEDVKMQIVARLGRNVLTSEFLDIVGPVLLSRTVVPGEVKSNKTDNKKDDVESDDDKAYNGSICWQTHWRLSLLLFSWIGSIAGAEGLAAAKSTGRLLLASGHAGSLLGAMDGCDNATVSAIFLPSPAVALMIGYALRSEWSYNEMLADRLQIMMPLLPGVVISLLPRISLAKSESVDKPILVVSDVLVSIGSAFQRVFGGMLHASASNSRDGSSEIVKSVKVLAPHLVVVAWLIETFIMAKAVDGGDPDVYVVDVDPNKAFMSISKDDDSFSSFKEILAHLPSENEAVQTKGSTASLLRLCESSVLETTAVLISFSMSHGGAGAAHSLWNILVQALEESVSHDTGGHVYPDTSSKPDRIRCAFNILCRLLSLVLKRAMKRSSQWDVWSYEQASAVATICIKIEETGLLRKTYGTTLDTSEKHSSSNEQVSLLLSLLELLSYGRDVTGWCQLSLPSMTSTIGDRLMYHPSAASRLMIPVLQPCVRVLLRYLDHFSLQQTTKFPIMANVVSSEESSSDGEAKYIVDLVVEELDLTLTAAIVGLSFPAARETALHALACLRRTLKTNDPSSEKFALLTSLFLKVVEELRARYESERRSREKALFDGDEMAAEKDALDDSQAVERLIMGSILGLEPDHLFKGEDNANKVVTQASLDSGSASFGLEAALEECRRGDMTDDDWKDKCMSSLQRCLDSQSWEIERRECDFDNQLAELFASGLQIRDESTRDVKVNDGFAIQPLSTSGTDNAADVVGGFFECAASEKSRLKEIAQYFPGLRCNRISYSERYCWARYMEFNKTGGDYWERGIPDGNRDVRSRLPTVPCYPEFRRFIPSFLDHYSDKNESEEHDVDNLTSSDTSRRVSSVLVDMDTLTKNLLEAGSLEIVDITKTEVPEEEEDEDGPDLLEKRVLSMDSDDEDPEYLPTGERAASDESGGFEASRPDERKPKETSTSYGTGAVSQGRSIPINSAFSTPPDNSSSSLHLMHTLGAGIEHHVDECLHVRSEGSRVGSLLLTASHLILEYHIEHDGYYEGEVLTAQEDAQREQVLKDAGEHKENDPEGQFQHRVDRKRREIALMRPQSIRWNLSEVSHVYLRRYRLRDSSLEIFFIPSGGASFGGTGMFSPSTSLFLDFGPGHDGLIRRDDIAFAIMQRSPPQAIKQWPDRSAQFLHDQLSRLTVGWAEGRITNFDYLLHLNMLSGRSYNDICQYPVFPWVLSDYTSEEIPDLSNPDNFRDLSKPVGALNAQRLAEFKERFESFVDPSIPPFMYGSHYSTSAGVVLHFLVRLHPFAGLHRQLQGGHFDVADRLFCSVPRTWSMCTGTSAAEVKELTPEWYCNPAFLRNTNKFKLGTSQDGDVLGDVVLPPWAKESPEKFVEVMRAALESDVCTRMLPGWIDLIFGRKQQGSEAIKANNVFFYLTYYGSVDVASIEDESLRQATELQIAHFGQCPMQLFRRHHIAPFPFERQNLSFFQLISAHNQVIKAIEQDNTSDGQLVAKARQQSQPFGEPRFLPFFGAPISRWVHLDAPPPGPHSPLIAVRFAGTDRCLAVDEKGIFHTFRWAWRVDEQGDGSDLDQGCFIAQRELPRFRSVPRLMYSPPIQGGSPAVAISKTLFAGRSVLLVLSDGDGKGGLAMQLVDPSKGSIRGEVLIPVAHSSEITCITTDPIGTAAGHGGVGGELALVGSADGTASLWRFMSSHYLPLRPRARFAGHNGAKIVAVALNSTTQLAAAVSAYRFCLYSIGNGTIVRSFGPPTELVNVAEDSATSVETRFADTPAVAVSSQGFLVAVCESMIEYSTMTRTITTLNLFSIEGLFLGSRPMERWRGVPHKMTITPDGTAVLVCSGRGITIHRLSACQPLEVIDEWVVSESDDLDSPLSVDHAYDLDLGPSLNRPIAAAAACSNGALRLHALPGISQWSERHKKSGFGSSVGSALVKPAQSVNRALKGGISFGSRIAGLGRDIGKEVTADVKEAGVGGFLGGFMSRRRNNNNNNNNSGG